MLIAITREVSPAIARCELTHLVRVAIDYNVAQAQHRQYMQALAALGCEMHTLPAEPDLPDSVFVEDAAIVLDELAIITRPGADSRKPETVSIAQALQPYRKLSHYPAARHGERRRRLSHWQDDLCLMTPTHSWRARQRFTPLREYVGPACDDDAFWPT